MENKTSPTYGSLGARLLATIIDLGCTILIIPIFYNIYLYYTQGQTIGYKALGLHIYDSTEQTKPSKSKLLGRFVLKYLFNLFSLSIFWFVATFVFFVLYTILEPEILDLEIKKALVNYILGIRTILSIIVSIVNIIAVLVSHKKTTLYDILASTIVIKKTNE